MEYRVKVTVLDKKLFPELQTEYCAVPDSGKCPCYNVGDEFMFYRNDERDDYWCFCDNFEWLEGESARFGLINVDYATQTRTIKRSGEFYADMIRNDGVTDEAYNTYVRGEVYRVE